MTSPFQLALALGLVLATGSAARADIGVIVLEPVSALGFFTRVGHAGTYLSNICPDGSVKMRLCLPGTARWRVPSSYAQIPGTFSRSRGVLFPMENTYRNIAFAPYWYFGGFREVALGAMFYHEVINRFDVLDASRDFMSLMVAELTVEQHRLRQRQDAIRVALTSAQHDAEWPRLPALNASVSRRLSEIGREKGTEVARVEGSKAQWRALEREFQSMIRDLSARLVLRRELQRRLEEFASNASLSQQLLRSFEADGEFHVDRGGPWIRLPLAEGEWRSTGLSRSHILAGDPRLATLILAAVIDYLRRAQYDKEFGVDYEKPHGFARFLAFAYRLIPKIGPFRALRFSVPTPEAERLRLASFTATRERFRQSLDAVSAGRLRLVNTNFDTGRPTARGEYAMADETYDELLGKLADHAFTTVSAPLRANLVEYYRDADSLPAGTDVERARPATIRQRLVLLGAVETP